MTTVREAALALLTHHADTLNHRSGQFLGQIAVSATPLSEKQAGWLAKLLERAGLPPLDDGSDA
ncbi:MULTISPECIES: hypothetical protein [unclassified Sphingomonas]|uniref:hypothetical protein n=1 Tax=unclassified Sphingomonas TaxID=196159 RepID=UPI000B2BAE82|nr:MULTISPECIES: hypothetical protein [unclassified Sphingomonas]